MSDDWPEVALGDFCSIKARLVDPTLPEYQELPHLGIDRIESGTGVLFPLASAAEDGVTSGKYLFSPQDVVYSKIRPELQKAAFPRFAGLASADAYPLRAGAECLPGFLLLLLLSPSFSEAAVAMSGRTKMPKINRSELLSIRVVLPPMSKQRRIVDLFAALDAQLEALSNEQQRADELLRCVLDSVWEASPSDARIPLGQVADLASGPSWSAADEFAAPVADATPVVKITNTRPDGTLDLSERLYVRGLPRSTRLIGDSSLIAIRTNGNRDRIGNVYVPSNEVVGSAVSAFQFIVQAQSPHERDYLYWALRAPRCQHLMSSAASGSTGLGNLGAKWLRALELPWPEDLSRAEFVENATALGSVVTALASERGSLSLDPPAR